MPIHDMSSVLCTYEVSQAILANGFDVLLVTLSVLAQGYRLKHRHCDDISHHSSVYMCVCVRHGESAGRGGNTIGSTAYRIVVSARCGAMAVHTRSAHTGIRPAVTACPCQCGAALAHQGVHPHGDDCSP